MHEFEDLKETYTRRICLKEAILGTLPGDRPLLEELGIDLGIVKSESLLPLKVLQNENITVSNDLTGPVIILTVFTFSLVLQCKIHFGYIYLISLTSSFLIYVLLSLLTAKEVAFSMCCNVMGYSMTPVVVFSFVNMLLSWGPPIFRAILGIGMSIWSAYTASVVFCMHQNLPDKVGVVLYPLFLAYICYTMMVIF